MMDATIEGMGGVATIEAPAKARKARPIRVGCPKCGQVGGEDQTALVWDLGTARLHCMQCDEDVTRAELALAAEEIARLVRLLDLAAAV